MSSPTAFSIMDPEIGELRDVTGVEADGNELHENFKDSQDHQAWSSRQEPRTYKFTTGNSQSICLIDTPGIGDVRGVEEDRQNMDLIMLHLNTISELHGIGVLPKPNVTRISVHFQFCVKELLSRCTRAQLATWSSASPTLGELTTNLVSD